MSRKYKSASLKEIYACYKNVFSQLRHPLPYIMFMTIFASNGFVFNYIFAVLLRDVINSVMNQGNDILNIVFRFLIYFAGYLVLLGSSVLISNIIVLNLERTMFSRIISSFLYRDIRSVKLHTGDIMSRIDRDMNSFMGILCGSFISLLVPLISGIGSIIVIFSLSIPMGFFCIGIGVFGLGAQIIVSRPLKSTSEIIQKAHGVLNSYIVDAISGGLVIRIFNSRNLLMKKYDIKSKEILDTSMKRIKVEVLQTFFGTISGWLSYVGIILFGYLFLARGTLDLPSLMMIPTMCSGVVSMFLTIGGQWAGMQKNIPGADRVFEALDITSEQRNVKGTELQINKNEVPGIRFKNISFSYSDSKKNVLESFEYEIKPGEIIAVMGRSGTGKTTIVNLLLGILKPQEGEIYIGDNAMSEHTLASWRNVIAYVPQGNDLLNGSYKYNLKMGNIEASHHEIAEAVQKANIKSFISSLKSGLDSDVGVDGSAMSGGQKQRIALARAFLKDARILILDEPVSALDEENEMDIVKTIESMRGKATVIFVTHRKALAEMADRVLNLD